ncbi:MAG: hypothetical protein ACFFHD_12740 [Promethearchaeota archaeon]
MSIEVTEQVKNEIFKLISIPGVELEDISKKTNLDHDTILKILSEEYLKCNLDFGRRLCCRF